MNASKLVALLVSVAASPSALACDYPALPHIPVNERINGRVERAVKEDMIRYVTEMSIYVACVGADHSAAVADEAADLHVSLLAARNNVAVAELKAVRDVYVDKVGPLEELFFDSGNRRSAEPQLPTIPTGPDIVLRRAELLRGGGNCLANDAACSKAFTKPGVD